MNRRNFLKLIGAGVLTATMPTYATLVEPAMLDIVEQAVPLRRIGPGMHGLRAAQLSDIHAGPWFTQAHLEQVVKHIIEQKPELVFITGDFITRGGDYPSMEKVLFVALRQLASQVPVFSVLGNHDYYRRADADLRKMLSNAGVQDVTNTYLPYQRGGETILIAGVGSALAGNMRLSQLERDLPKGSTTILMAHEPDVAKMARSIPEIVLQLSGHTHGGQVVLPFSGPIVKPRMGRLYPAGLYDLGTMYLYTNRGLGMTSVPIRLNCPPELTVFTFYQAAENTNLANG
jgi:predicted MPP superfamily phosphohydrolase